MRKSKLRECSHGSGDSRLQMRKGLLRVGRARHGLTEFEQLGGIAEPPTPAPRPRCRPQHIGRRRARSKNKSGFLEGIRTPANIFFAWLVENKGIPKKAAKKGELILGKDSHKGAAPD